MSTPAPADARLLAASQKQLEELDALLERMLQLPVVEEEPAPIPETMPEAVPVVAADHPQDLPTTNEIPEEPSSKWEGEAPAEPVEAARQETRPPEQPLEEWPEPRPPQEADGEPRRVRPLLACVLAAPNWLFDQATRPLGGAGRWLRGDQGRTLLGFTGLALLAAAAVVGVLDWILGNW